MKISSFTLVKLSIPFAPEFPIPNSNNTAFHFYALSTRRQEWHSTENPTTCLCNIYSHENGLQFHPQFFHYICRTNIVRNASRPNAMDAKMVEPKIYHSMG